jgi:diaminopimelate epimerase
MIKKEIEFFKYHGTGNDFILINSFNDNIDLPADVIENMCHRQFGIGADGLMILRKKDGFDFEMDFYNSDGNRGSMCGNGGRCIVAFAHDMGVITDKAHFIAPDGEHFADFISYDKIKLTLRDVNNIEEHELGVFMDTGSPHLVIFKEHDNNLNVFEDGKAVRYSETYKENGVNVNFVIPQKDVSKVYTYERGVENQTFSCGTGTVASAIALNKLENRESPVEFNTLGGKLMVYFTKMNKDIYKNIWLEGPVRKVFSGVFSIK